MGIENLLAQGVEIRPAGMERNALMQYQQFQDAKQRNALMRMQMDDMQAQRQQALQAAQQQADWRNALQVPQGQQVMQPGRPAMNAAQAESAVGTPGYGTSSAQDQMRTMPADPRMVQAVQMAKAGQMSPMDLFKIQNPERKLMGVKAGETVIDERTGQPVFTGTPKADKPPSAVQEYQFAVGQGYKGTFEQWDTTRKKAGATNLSVNTEKSYGGEIAQGLAKADLAALDIARSAPDRVRSAADVKRILSTGNTITGTAAEQRLWLDKALSTAGVIDSTRTQATEDLVNLLANQTLDAIKTSGLGSGQGFTDKDRQFLQDAKAGRIEINAKTLYRMADLNEKSARASIAYGNKVAARLKNNPILGTIGQDLEVQAPADLNEAIAAEARRRGLGGK